MRGNRAMVRLPRWLLGLGLMFWLASSAMFALRAQPPEPLQRVQQIVVIFLENRSFDHLFGHFPGADGLANAGPAAAQIDLPGPTLPQPLIFRDGNMAPDARFPANLPNGPYPIDRFARQDSLLPSPVHQFFEEQAQINGGAMNRFVAVTNAGGAVMGYHEMRGSHHWQLAAEFTLADRFFHSAFGGSFLNHAFLVCSCAFQFPNAPEAIRVKEDFTGRNVPKGSVTNNNEAVNTLRSVYLPRASDSQRREQLVPPQTMPHFGDRMDAAGVTWKWYSGGYDDAAAGRGHEHFQYHHQPFAYFANLAPGTPAREEHLRDGTDFLHDIAANSLPRVSFYKPLGTQNMHPSYSTVPSGDAHLGEIVARLRASPAFANMLIIVTYDENGGFWDHVAPPKRDAWGPGTRVPTIVIGPMVKRGFVDHTPYDHGSILRTIQLRFNVAPVNEIDGRATPLLNLLQ